MSILSNGNVLLRAVEPEDADVIFEWENNTDNWSVSNTLVPFSYHTITQYALNASQDIFEARQLRLIIVDIACNAVVVAVDLYDFDPYHQRAGVWVLINSPENRRQGFAFQAIELLKKYAFDFLHMKQLYCGIGASNSSSIKLFEKSGFEFCGVRKAWLRTSTGWEDEHFYQCINK